MAERTGRGQITYIDVSDGEQGPQGEPGQRTATFGVRATTPIMENFAVTIISQTSGSTGSAIDTRGYTISVNGNPAAGTFVHGTDYTFGTGGSTTGITREYRLGVPTINNSFTIGSDFTTYFERSNSRYTNGTVLTFNSIMVPGSASGLTNAQVETLFRDNNTVGFTSSIAGDTVFVDGANIGETVAYEAQGSGVWNQLDSLIDGNLLVTGSITAENAIVGSLNADVITTGTLSADRIQLDDATLDTDANGNLVVQTISGGGILTSPSGLGVDVDGESIVVRDGQLEAVSTTTTINTVTWSGGQTARTYNRSPNVISPGSFGDTGRTFNDAVFIWRYDMNTIGSAQYQALTGITLENFDMNVTVNNRMTQRETLSGISFDLEYYTASGTTTGFNTASTFDGRIRVNDLQAATINTSISGSASGTFSTINSQFTPPSGNGRFLFLGFRFQAELSNAVLFDIGDVTYTITTPSQSDTRMILHFENGSSRTETFNSFFV